MPGGMSTPPDRRTRKRLATRRAISLAADRLFIYPPILFIIGLVAMIKGLAGGNEE